MSTLPAIKKPFVESSDVSIVVGTTVYREPPRTYSNLWVIRLDADVASKELVGARMRATGECERRDQAGCDRRELTHRARQPAGAPGVKVTCGGSR